MYRDANHADIPSLEFGQELCFEDIFAVALFVQIHRQIEMEIDDPTGVQPLDSLFDGFFCSGHSVAATYDRRIYQENRGLTQMSRTQFRGQLLSAELQHAHGVGAFRMRDDRRVWILFANFVYTARGELDVDVTGTLP